jgi:molybdenum cofactor cytidylyltransferase
MGRPKATLRIDGKPFVARSVELLHGEGLHPLIVVAGKHFEQTLAALPVGPEVQTLHNPQPERGQLHSLKLALRSLQSAPNVSGAMVALVDHPRVRPATVRALLAAAREDGIAVPRHGGRRGHPVVFGRALFGELLATADEDGARIVVRNRPDRVTIVEVDDPGILLDIDTLAEYESLAGAGRAW